MQAGGCSAGGVCCRLAGGVSCRPAHGGGRGEGAGFDRLLGSLFVHTVHVETLGDRGAVHLDETMRECSWCSEGCEAVQWRRCSDTGVVRWRLRVCGGSAVVQWMDSCGAVEVDMSTCGVSRGAVEVNEAAWARAA